jgi:hypothetical protein
MISGDREEPPSGKAISQSWLFFFQNEMGLHKFQEGIHGKAQLGGHFEKMSELKNKIQTYF